MVSGADVLLGHHAGPPAAHADELEPYRDAEGFLALGLRVSVNGAMVGQDLPSNMGWPFEDLISYAGHRQVPLGYAHRSYAQAVASPHRELRIFTAGEGATEHIGLDHLPQVSTFIADWVAGTFAGL